MASTALLHKAGIVKEGFLKKTPSSKGEDVFRGNWQDRYFKVYRDRLEYYRKIDDNKPAGTVDLRSALIEAIEPSSAGGMPFCLRIAEAKQVWLYLCAGSARDRDDWLSVLRRCAGVEEDLQDTLASVAAAHLTDRALNACAFTLLLQDLSAQSTPELVTIALGGEGMLRIYSRDAKLWRTYDGTQIVKVQSNLKAETGIGVGPNWRLVVEVALELKLHPATSGLPTVSTARYSLYVSSVDEAATLVPLLRGLARNEVAGVARVCKRAAAIESCVDIADASFRTGWTMKYALLNANAQLVIFRNSNDSSPWRAVYLLADATISAGEHSQDIVVRHLLEKDPITIRLPSAGDRDEWLSQAQHVLGLVRQDRADAAAIAAATSASAPLASTAAKRTFTPLSSDSLGATSSAPVKKLQLADLSLAAPAPAARTNLGASSLFDFAHPPITPEWKQGDPSYVLTFGSGSSGQLGHRNKDDVLRPTVIELIKSKSVRFMSAGQSHAALVTEQGHVYMIGSGAIGLGERVQESRVPHLLTSLIATPVRTVACGRAHTLALTTAGAVFAWGRNVEGQLGLGHTTPVLYPTRVDALTQHGSVAHIAAGGAHSVCVTKDHNLFTWGGNAHGCLGIGSTDVTSTPTINAALRSKSVRVAHAACGEDFTLVISSAGELYAVGNNAEGQLGMGDRLRRSLFGQATFFSKRGLRVFSVTAGAAHAVALALVEPAPKAGAAAPAAPTAADVQVYTFGAAVCNAFREAQPTPVFVGALANTRQISTSSAAQHTLSVNASGRAFAFGRNQFGELGNGTPGVQALVKIRLVTGISVAATAAGAMFSLLLCRGTPPAHIMAGAEAAAEEDQLIDSDPIVDPMHLALGITENGPVDLSTAMDQIGKLLMLEATLNQDLTGEKGEAPKMQIQPGTMDFWNLKTVPNEITTTQTGRGPVVEPAVAPAPPSDASTDVPPPPADSTNVPLPTPPVVSSLTSRPAPAPFTFTAAATAAVPIPAPVATAAVEPPTAAVGGVAAKLQMLEATAGATRAPIQIAPLYTVPVAAAAAQPTVALPVPSLATAPTEEKKKKPPLPPGWKKVKDETSGRSFYYHTTTKMTTWKRPKPEVEDAPPPPPAVVEEVKPQPTPAVVTQEELPPPPAVAAPPLPPPPADDLPPPPPAPAALPTPPFAVAPPTQTTNTFGDDDDDDDIPPPPPPPPQ